MQGNHVGDEWEAQWDGRAVIVRTVTKRSLVNIICLLLRLRLTSSVQAEHRSLVTYHPNLWVHIRRWDLTWPDTLVSSHHPQIAQVIGYSHPSLSDRFYVVDAGTALVQFTDGLIDSRSRDESTSESIPRPGYR